MSEILPNKSRESTMLKVLQAISNGFHILFPSRSSRPERYNSRTDQVLDAFSTAGISALYPREFVAKEEDSSDINRLAP
jgi:hypothetical protein